MKTAGLLARLLLAAVWLWAGAAKLAAPAVFATDIARYHLLPAPGPALLAVYLPWLELVLAAALLARPPWRGAALACSMTLLAVFSAALATAWARGLDLRCGCFGAGSPTAPWALARNALLLGLAVLARREPTAASAQTPPPPAGVR